MNVACSAVDSGEELLLRLLGLALQRLSGRGERDPLAPAVLRVAFAGHEVPPLHLVEVADQVAAVEPEPVREVVLPDLQRSLGAEPTTVTWVLSAFLLSASVSTGLLGRLGDMFGKRRVLLAALTVSALGTLLAALATDIGVLITARAVQGVGAATFPLAFGIVREQFPRERVPVAIGWISSTFGIGFGVGLVLPGLIVDTFGWQSIFWVMLAVTVAGIVAVRVWVEESVFRSPGRVDLAGALLLTGGRRPGTGSARRSPRRGCSSSRWP